MALVVLSCLLWCGRCSLQGKGEAPWKIDVRKREVPERDDTARWAEPDLAIIIITTTMTTTPISIRKPHFFFPLLATTGSPSLPQLRRKFIEDSHQSHFSSSDLSEAIFFPGFCRLSESTVYFPNVFSTIGDDGIRQCPSDVAKIHRGNS